MLACQLGTHVLCQHVIRSLGADFINRWKWSSRWKASSAPKKESIGGRVSGVVKYSRHALAVRPQRCLSPGHVFFALDEQEQILCWPRVMAQVRNMYRWGKKKANRDCTLRQTYANIVCCTIYCSGIFSLNDIFFSRNLASKMICTVASHLWVVTVPFCCASDCDFSETPFCSLFFSLAFTSFTITLCLRHRVFILFGGTKQKQLTTQHTTDNSVSMG